MPSINTSRYPDFNFKFFQLLLIMFGITGVLIVGTIYAYTEQNFQLKKRQYISNEVAMLDRAASEMHYELSNAISELRRVAHSQMLANYIEKQRPDTRRDLEHAFQNLVLFTKRFDQIRLLDADGKEVVRVNKQNGNPAIVPPDQLQDKSQRYYFLESRRLADEAIYISPLDLNVEKGRIENPHKPIMRLITPIFKDEELYSLLAFNYLAQPLLDRFRAIVDRGWGDSMLVNRRGYWLSHPDQTMAWGFMFGNDLRFPGVFSEKVWQAMLDQEKGQLETDKGLLIFNTVEPAERLPVKTKPESQNGNIWKLISHVPSDQIQFSLGKSVQENLSAYALLLGIALLASGIIAWFRVNMIAQRSALIDGKEQLRVLIDLAPDGIFIADLEGRYTDVNQAGCRMLGYERDGIVGKTILDFIPQEDVPKLEDSKAALLQSNIAIDEWRLRHKQGHYLPVEVSARITADGRWQGFVRDISARRKAEHRQRQAEVVFDNTSEAILITNEQGIIVAVNPAYEKITGYTQKEVLGKSARIHQSGKQDQAFYQEFWKALQTKGEWQGEIWNRRKNGEVYPAWETISAVNDESARVIQYVCMLSDISYFKETEAKLTHLAHHDALTGLPNRMAFLVHLEQVLERARRHRSKVALLFLDLDRFKLINDTLGHDAGDQLLKIVAKRLKHTIRGEDFATRLGGDEFTVLMEDVKAPQDAAALSSKIIRALEAPIELHQQDISTSTSIGISIFPDDAQALTDLMKAADATMYRAKNRGRGRYEFYTSEITAQALERLGVETDLRLALENNEFMLHYQPQVSIKTGKITGVEALLRWQHPKLGLMMPDQFIPVAEETGLIHALGEWVIHEAFEQAHRWRNLNMPPIRMGINVSGRQLLYDQTQEIVRKAIAHNGDEIGDMQFELEITETVLQSGKHAVATLEKLRAMGATIAIDDFGTGYSSLSKLKRLPIDTLKIDRGFLQQVSDPDTIAIAKAIISLGQNLGLKVIAEGVENIAQLNFLRERGCDELQGFLISQPVEAKVIEDMIVRDNSVFRELL